MDSHSLKRNTIKQKRESVPPGMAYCCRCDQYKDTSDFNANKSRKNGLYVYCRLCAAELRRSPKYQAHITTYRQRRKTPVNPDLPSRKNVPDGMAYCSRCKSHKNKSEFSSDRTRKSGLSYWCKSCQSANATTPEKRARKRELFRLNNSLPENIAKRIERRDSVEQRARIHKTMRQYRYGLSPEDHHKLLDKQNGVCAICKKPETKIVNGKLIPLSVDHDHVTGKVRGLLCRTCNNALGQFKDSLENLYSAIKYLSEANR